MLKPLIAAAFALVLVAGCVLTTSKTPDKICPQSVDDLIDFCTEECKDQDCLPVGFFSKFPFERTGCACFCPKPALKLEVKF